MGPDKGSWCSLLAVLFFFFLRRLVLYILLNKKLRHFPSSCPRFIVLFTSVHMVLVAPFFPVLFGMGTKRGRRVGGVRGGGGGGVRRWVGCCGLMN